MAIMPVVPPFLSPPDAVENAPDPAPGTAPAGGAPPPREFDAGPEPDHRQQFICH